MICRPRPEQIRCCWCLTLALDAPLTRTGLCPGCVTLDPTTLLAR
jgi:hypothetical protein